MTDDIQISKVIKLINAVVPFYKGPFEILLSMLADDLVRRCHTVSVRPDFDAKGSIRSMKDIEFEAAKLFPLRRDKEANPITKYLDMLATLCAQACESRSTVAAK